MEQQTTFRGRFAPTPSGKMHIGNALTALLGWLQMKSLNGLYVLRIEDIDVQRSRQDLATQIVRDLEWLGLDWDEGRPGCGGASGPCRRLAKRSRGLSISFLPSSSTIKMTDDITSQLFKS